MARGVVARVGTAAARRRLPAPGPLAVLPALARLPPAAHAAGTHPGLRAALPRPGVDHGGRQGGDPRSHHAHPGTRLHGSAARRVAARAGGTAGAAALPTGAETVAPERAG